MRTIKISLIIFIVFSISGILKAQNNIVKLSIEEALILADKNSKNIQEYEARFAMSESDFAMTKSIFLPDINFSHTGVLTTDPLSVFGFKLKQKITKAEDFNPALLNDPSVSRNFQTKISLNQSILNLDALYLRKASNLGVTINSLALKRTRYAVSFEIKKAYYMYSLLHNSLDLLNQALVISADNIRLSENNLAQGFIRKSDLLLAKVHQLELESQVLSMKSKLQQVNDLLVYNLALPESSIIHTMDTLSYERKIVSNKQDISTRSDILASAHQVLVSEEMLKANKMKFIPRLNAFASYEWNDSKLMGNKANNYMLGASLSWNIFSGNKNFAQLKKSKYKLNLSNINYSKKLEQSNLELKNARREVEILFSRIKVSKLAYKQASESLSIITNRYKLGMETTKDLLDAELKNTSKALKISEAIYKYNISIFYLEFLTEQKL